MPHAVFHPTDFSGASQLAFAHALRIAVANRARLSILHVDGPGEQGTDFDDYPHVRETLVAWGLLPTGSPRSAVFDELGLRVRKTELAGGAPRESLLAAIEEDPADIVVTATRAGGRWQRRLFHESVALALAERARRGTLILPEGMRGVVDPQSGGVALQRLLVVQDGAGDGAMELALAERVAAGIGAGKYVLRLLRTDAAAAIASAPVAQAPVDAVGRVGHAPRLVPGEARAWGADLVVMRGRWRHGLAARVLGSPLARMLRLLPCPLYLLPEAEGR